MVGALRAFRRSAEHALNVRPYRQAAAAPPSAAFKPAFQAAMALDPEAVPADSARRFFETYFTPLRILPDEGEPGRVTAFYEPIVDARRRPDATWRYPFLRRPAGLEAVRPGHPSADLPPDFPEDFAYALRTPSGLTTCPDRQAIDRGAFAGQDLEIAYAASKADVFFAQIQGAARLRLENGEITRITYAAKSGHPFTAIGRLLAERGAIPAAKVSMQSIHSWLTAHPDEADALMWENRSYIFFKEIELADDGLGPVAAAKVQLEPGRSLAIDRVLHSFGTPFFVTAPALRDFDCERSFARLMIAQDTGSAIVGPARGDLFTGSGDRAAELAGAVNAVADFIVLLPRGAASPAPAGQEPDHER
ncbi:MltA domain-containing protein [Pseudohoeflea coraliihabitans]|uniref:peptidoglycan lytic exotransglycosylase n=1 Tax=Pseudohoeflea coraliihabitans TaxID=2860393 RepID=A0ABS6WT42_9HYPH|nr:MltA domain-containing protein [Pseudohoeflea sp. DP4N28-3]